MTTIVSFAWGPGIREAAEETATYVARLYAGFCRYATLPFKFILFVDPMNSALPAPAPVEKRVFEIGQHHGCLPKLYAHSAEAGLSGRVLLVDLDTIICGDVDPLLAWRGPFMSRADERDAAHGTWQSGGNMQSFEAGTTRELWTRYAADPARFIAETNGWERMAIRLYGPPDQTFIQREFPGLMLHMERDIEAKRVGAHTKGASVIIATGELRPHRVSDNGVRKAWERLDDVLRIKLIETGERHRNHIAALYEDGVRARLRDAGVEIVGGGPHDAALVHCVGTEDGNAIPPQLPMSESRIIVLEKVDGAQIHPAHRPWFVVPGLVGWLKSYRARDQYPRRALHGRYHAAELTGRGEPIDYPAKVDLWYGFGRYENCRAFAQREPDWTAPRDIDVHFRGRTEFPYPGGEPIAMHRQSCIAAIRKLPHKTVAESVRWTGEAGASYVDELYRARVVVSPWGYGEACIRDYEALLAGCALVKPRSDWYVGLTDIAPHVVWCAPDWRDLGNAVACALERSNDVAARRAARALVMQEWDDTLLAQRIAGRLWRICGATEAKPVGKPRIIYRPGNAMLATPLPRRTKVGARGPKDE